jgi:hypothetical protein
MKDWNNIEKEMKTVVNADMVAPPEFIWSAIEENIESKDPKSSGWYIWLGMGVVISAAIWGLNNYIINKDMPTIGSSISEQLIESNQIEIPTVQQNAIVADELPIAESSESNMNTEGNNLSSVTTVDNIDAKESATDQTGRDISNTKELTKSTSAKVSNENMSKTKPLSLVNKMLDNVISDVSSQKAKVNLATSPSQKGKIYRQGFPVENVVKESTKNNISKNTSASYLASSLSNEKGNAVKSRSLLVDQMSIIGMSTSVLETERDMLDIKDKVECPSFSNRISISPFIELNGIIGRHNKSFQTRMIDELDPTALLNGREDTESSWYNWGGQFHVGLNINRNIYFGTGLEISQSKDKFRSELSGITQQVVNFDQDNNPIDTMLVSGTFVSSGEVRYNMVDIPIFVGLTKSVGSWDVGLELGALLNISFSATGKVLDEDLEVTTLESTPLAYRDKLGMGLRGSVVLRKYLSGGLSFHVKPTFKTYLGSVSQVNYPLDTKLNFMRFDVGMRMDF